MNYQFVGSKFLDAKATGDHSGDWVAESKFIYNVVPNVNDATKAAFQIWASLMMEFSNGGSIEYHCELLYLLTDVTGRPNSLQVASIGHECTRDLELLFDRKNVVTRDSTNAVLWKSPSIPDIQLKIIESLNKNFQPI